VTDEENDRQKNNHIDFKIVHVTLTEEVDEPNPPPPGLQTKFDSVQEWLASICDGIKPEKSINTYRFGLFESSLDYTLVLVGVNTYTEGNHAVTNIDFEPSNMHFRLPPNEFDNETREKVIAKLITQLTNFTKSEEFKKSFLAQAKSINVDFNGEIWSTRNEDE
jgi:hypothetical protein